MRINYSLNNMITKIKILILKHTFEHTAQCESFWDSNRLLSIVIQLIYLISCPIWNSNWFKFDLNWNLNLSQNWHVDKGDRFCFKIKFEVGDNYQALSWS